MHISTFFNTFPIWPALNVVKYPFIVKMCFCPSVFFFVSPAPSISTLPCCSGLSLHISPCNPLTYLSHWLLPRLPPSLPLPLSLSGWLVDSFYCLLSAGIPSEKSSCCGQAVCGCACCRGEPNAAESQRAPFQASSFFAFVNKTLCCLWKWRSGFELNNHTFNKKSRIVIMFTKYW